ncbi:MAG: hypothetical protein GX896_03215, partial [Clostridiales bacterium]|nr:hypothetical protein [Clostridiales bacterium]
IFDNLYGDIPRDEIRDKLRTTAMQANFKNIFIKEVFEYFNLHIDICPNPFINIVKKGIDQLTNEKAGGA